MLKEAAIWYFGESAGLDFRKSGYTDNGKHHKRRLCNYLTKTEITFFILMVPTFTTKPSNNG
jgi:hypothetical protein